MTKAIVGERLRRIISHANSGSRAAILPGRVVESQPTSLYSAVIPTSQIFRDRDEVFEGIWGSEFRGDHIYDLLQIPLYKRRRVIFLLHPIKHQKRFKTKLNSTINSHIADHLYQSLHDLTIGAEEGPIALPSAILNQAAAANRFVVVGRVLIPQRQNLRSLIAVLPRSWGLSGIVHGRLTGHRLFQFVFPSEELMETTLRRGLWAFADRMIVLQRWFLMMNPMLLNRIPFWVQIRGIPFQFLNREVIEAIGDSLGQWMEIEFDGEAAVRVEYVRIRLNVNVLYPLHFQRIFQFSSGVNTLLRLRYERLRGVCGVCGMLNHDNGHCLNQNGGEEHSFDGDDGEGQLPNPHQNQGAIIEEVNEDEPVEVQSVAEQEVPAEIEINGELHDDVFEGLVNRRIIKPELVMTNIVVDYGESSMKRKGNGFMANGKTEKQAREEGESSGTHDDQDENTRGAVGPIPPQEP